MKSPEKGVSVMEKFLKYYNSPIGMFELKATDKHLTHLSFVENIIDEERDCDLLTDVINQLDEYFLKKRKIFQVPMLLEGTTFRKQVWQALQGIPYGKVVSYKDVGTMIGNPKASRAVGQANNSNPIAIIIPCHRVIGANKKLVGYGGGLDKKEYLLELENIKIWEERNGTT
jgi:methylated-DNA-[protein]-cysteine S-methyltransferase